MFCAVMQLHILDLYTVQFWGCISQTFSKANGNVCISTGEYYMGVASNVHKQEKVTYEKQLNVIC